MTSVAFFGSHPLGEACLERLAAHEEITVKLVATYRQDYDGWWNGSVHDLALEFDYPVVTLEDDHRVTDIDIDYLLSVYYPKILGPELLDHPAKGALNLHQAELPRYRGSNVFSHAIMNARNDNHWRYGTTFHFMAEEVDAGDIVARNFVPITEDDTARDLYERTRAASIVLFEQMIPELASDGVHDMRRPQSEFDGKRYFYTKDSLENTKEISPRTLARADQTELLELYDRIRALDFPPHEPAWTRIDGRKIYLTKSDYEVVLN